MTYLDYSATTPVSEEVLESFCQVSRKYIGNPNSLHRLGTEANEMINKATNQIADILKVKPSEIIYTSGSSESNNLAIKGIALKYKNRGNHIITTPLEHSSINGPLNYLMDNGFEVDFVELDENGMVDLENLKSLIKDTTILVSINSVNSEMSFSAHKIYGIKGIGCLIKKEGINLEPLIHGGKSTTIYRSGTPAVGLICSISKALRLATENLEKKYEHVLEINNYLREKLKNYDKVFINSNEKSIPFVLNMSVIGIKPETLQHAVEEDDIFISTQSACSSNTTMSKAVLNLTKDEERAKSSVRVSISYLTTKEEIDKFISSFDKIYKRLIG